jgi:CRP/FNR family transcriptional regulator
MTHPIRTASAGDMARCERCNVHNRGICGHANDSVLNELNHISRIRSCSAGETILAQGDDAGIVGNVIDGVLKITKSLPDGREQIVGLLFPTDFFGRIYSNIADFSIEAATDATICVMKREAFEHAIEHHNAIEHNMLIQLSSELESAREWMVLLGCQNTLEKVSSFFALLLLRADKLCVSSLPYKQGVVVAFPINRHDIAAYLGTTVETLSRQIQYLSRQKVIKILDGKHFEILDEDRLLEFAGQDREFLHPAKS